MIPVLGAARAFGVAAALTVTPLLAAAQLLTFQPGETRTNVAAAGWTIEASGTPGDDSFSRVVFSRRDAETQVMRLQALGKSWQAQTTRGRGALIVDFCVPRAGASGCDSLPDADAPTINVNLSFLYSVIGDLWTFFGSSASLAVTARLIDLEFSRTVVHRDLLAMQGSGGQVLTVYGVPVPVPEIEDAQQTTMVTMSTFIRRGQRYRFQLAGAATVNTKNGVSASANMYEPLTWTPFADSGRVELSRLTVSVAVEQPDPSARIDELETVVTALGQQVGALAERVDLLGDRLDAVYEEMGQALFDLEQRTAGEGALLLRVQGAPAPECARLVGRFRLVSAEGGLPRTPLMVDAYLMLPAAVPSGQTPSRRR